MPKYRKIKPLTIVQQRAGIRNYYSQLIKSINSDFNILDCTLKLQPSLESCVYEIRVIYSLREYPKAWMINPPLEGYEGKRPHHLYENDKDGHPQLCVFDPHLDDWHSQKSIATVFVPWVITWLYTYEIWLVTGEWKYPEGRAIKQKIKRKHKGKR